MYIQLSILRHFVFRYLCIQIRSFDPARVWESTSRLVRQSVAQLFLFDHARVNFNSWLSLNLFLAFLRRVGLETQKSRLWWNLFIRVRTFPYVSSWMDASSQFRSFERARSGPSNKNDASIVRIWTESGTAFHFCHRCLSTNDIKTKRKEDKEYTYILSHPRCLK